MASRPRGKVAVVVLSYGREQLFEPLVTDLIDRDGVAPADIVIAHNPFSPSDRWLPTALRGVRVHGLADNVGFAGGMNEGARLQMERGATHLLFLTHDARMTEGAIELLVDAAENHRQFGVLGPWLELADGSGLWSTGVVRTRGGVRHGCDRLAGTQPVVRDAIDGTVMLVRADTFAAVGGFERRFFMYWEETDFCLRAKKAGWKVGVVPGAVAFTQPGSAKRPAVHSYLMARNGLEYARRAGGACGIWWRTVDIFTSLAVLVPRPGGPRFRRPDAWRHAGLRWLGGVYGVIDFARQRWGPPPSMLTRWSDIR
jgi:GT2 family glycosyltransferase